MVKKSAHQKALEKIVASPSEFGIENVKGYIIEMPLYGKRGNIIAEPDIIFFCTQEIWIIEYKGNGNGEYYDKAQSQLSIAASWFAKYTPYDLEKIHTKIIAGNKYLHKLALNNHGSI